MKRLQLFALTLCLLMLALPVLTACGGAAETPTGGVGTIDVPTTGVDPSEIYDDKVVDLNGHEFVFLVQDSSSSHLQFNEIYAETLLGDKVNDAVFQRNSHLQDTFHCTIVEERNSSPLALAREALTAGEYVYDFIYARTSSLRSLSSSGLLADLMKLDSIDLSKAWWNHGFVDGLQIAGHLFYIAGDAITLDERAAQVIYFNRDLMIKNDIGDLYEILKKGQWTVDKMYEIGEACAEDDGDGVWSAVPGSKDVFAYGAGATLNDYAHVAAGGIYIGNFNADGSISIPPTLKPEIVNAWAKLKPLLTSNHRDVSTSSTSWRESRSAFYAVNMAAILNWSNLSIEFGILPFPKLSEEQENYYVIVGQTVDGSIGIPSTVDNIEEEAKACGFASGREMMGYFLSAFSYYSRQTLTPAFFDEVLKKQSVKDPDTGKILEFIMENKIYDPVAFFNFGSLFNIFSTAGYGGGDVVTDVNYENLVSMYEERYLSARSSLNSYLAVLETLDREDF